MKRWPKNRKTPYTRDGIARVPCCRCGAKSVHQWQVCADGRNYRGLCAVCDIALNRLVLRWMHHPQENAIMRRYITEVGR